MVTVRDVLAALLLEDGSRWIESATDLQVADALAVLEGEQPYHFTTRPRGGSKTTDAAACGLAWLLTAPPGARGYWAAADRDQAALGFDSLRGFLDRSRSLRSMVEVSAHRLTAASGASMETMPADAASSWGIRPEFLVVDEFAWWGDTPQARQFWESLSSAAAKSSTARMMVITSPSSPAHFSFEVLEQARGSDLWRVSELIGLVPWLDPARVEEQRRRQTEAQFRRLFLGEWAEGEEALAAAGDIDNCITHSGPLDPVSGCTYAIGADLGVKRDRTAVAVAHLDGDRVIVDRVAVWKGSRLRPVDLGEVEQWIEQGSRSYNRAPLVCDPWQALGMIQRLRGRGVAAEEFAFSQQSTSKLAGTMLDLIRGRRLGLPDDAELVEEFRSVRLVERSPGNFRIDHHAGKHDDMVIAVALAAWQLLRRPKVGGPGSIRFEPGRKGGGLAAPGTGGRVAWRPAHDGTVEHRRWASWNYSRNGESCPECEAEWRKEEAARAARRVAAKPEPVRMGRHIFTPKP